MATLATLVVKLTADAAGFHSEMGKAESRTSKVLGGIGKSVQGLGMVALGGIGVVAGAVTGAGVALGKLAIDAAPIEGVRNSFEGLTATVEGGSAGMLAALEQGSSGMIAQRDLMMKFNKAAGLVSTDFAVQLPEAMQYLSKVAASTGQDMDFMLESLVTGVGRLSPMILDNLNIQASLAEATAKAAEMFGVQESELTKTQQQAGMMAVVMEKLQANTAAMPDVAGSAAAGIAQMRAQFQNVKDQVGTAVLPTLNTLMGTFGKLTGAVLPPLVNFLETTLAPALERAAEFIDLFVTFLLGGLDPLAALQAALDAMGFGQIADTIGTVAAKVQELWAMVQPYVAQIAGWIGEHVALQDVLIAVGIAIAAVVIPALVSLVSAAAPVIAVAVVLIAIVALVRHAWENNWLGIRDKVAWVIDVLVPKIQKFIDFILSLFRTDLADLVGIVKTKFAEIKQLVVDTMNAILDFLRGIDLADIGRKIMESLKAGIMAKVASIKEAVRRAIQDIIDAAKGALDMLSPSRVFVEIGQNMMRGMALGIESLARMPEMRMEAAVAGVTGSAGLGRGGGRGMVILAPVFLDPREYVMAGGEIDYAAVGRRLREIQETI